jgi:purine-binding chemotaxis protein CheW
MAEETGTTDNRPGAQGAANTPAPMNIPEKKKVDNIQVVEFLLGKEHFAIDLFDVKEVVEYTRITHLPERSSYIKGIIDLRGEITTIIDLKQQLNIIDDTQESEEKSRIIVLDSKITKSKMGIMVDEVRSVSTYGRDQIDNTTTSSNKDSSNILGIIKKKIKIKDKEVNELLIWLDIRKLIAGIDM